ncbi:MAG: serine protease [Actinomycetia bacterium]|nr:serine protease [Actinomycetes bacterium]
MTVLEAISTGVRSVAQSINAAVVSVGRDGRGSGLVIDNDVVLTNAHNIRGGEITITFADGRFEVGEVTAVDVDGDLAVVRVATNGAQPLEWADPAAVELGAAVFAAARGRDGGLRVTFGTVSAVGRAFRGPRGRRISGSVEHTAPLPRGSSGGALVDAEAHLIGVNTHRLPGGFYLARPTDDDLRRRVDELLAGQVAEPRRIGVALASTESAQRIRRAAGLGDIDGLLVRGVEDDSPAARADLREGDVIVAVDGTTVVSLDDLRDGLDRAADEAQVLVVRGVGEVSLTVQL